MPNGHSLFQWIWHCPGGYLAHDLPPKARLSLETADGTDNIHPCGPTESENALGWKGPLVAIQPNPPAVSRDIFTWIRLLRAPSSLAWNVLRDGASTTSLSNLFHPLLYCIVELPASWHA